MNGTSLTSGLTAIGMLVSIIYCFRGRGGGQAKVDKVLTAGSCFVWGNVFTLVTMAVAFVYLALTQNQETFQALVAVSICGSVLAAPAALYSWAVLFRDSKKKSVYYPFLNCWTIAAFIAANGIVCKLVSIANPIAIYPYLILATSLMFISNCKIKKLTGLKSC
jgi:amino acid transporter